MVKFNKFCVTNGVIKSRVFYGLDDRGDGRQCVILYAKDYGSLGKIFPDVYENDIEKVYGTHEGLLRLRLFENHPLYQAARDRAESDLKVAA